MVAATTPIVGSHAWVEDSEVAWIDSEVLEVNGEEVKVSCTSGKTGIVEERMEVVQARKQRMISGALIDQEVRTARIEELKMHC
ncbi:hypothetical protein AAHE18_11G060800 [Arachis hypogaea]|uniref:Myosin N-terminal SH3-like domain-containing protein n=1 Tax=Arachis hypogaea TaxID=3818 RepID=A0A445AP43_ARAHY|nr:hypothetical protein Ahy_B01g052335 isoform A [Arachis hypogaea]